jgi:hypothetical protein
MEVSREIAAGRRTAAILVIVALVHTALPLIQRAAASGSTSAASSSFVVQQRWKLAGRGGWDYLTLDSAGKRLFISRDDHVEVLDTESGKVSGTVPGTKGVHGIALAEDLNRGFTSNGHGDSVTAFDLATLKVINEAPVSGQAVVNDYSHKGENLAAVHLNGCRTGHELGSAVVDLFRLEAGKIVEHWDVLQPIPEHAANPRAMV